MNKTLKITIALLLVAQSLFATGTEDFAASYRKAHEAQSIEAFSALVEFSPDTPKWIKDQIIQSFQTDSKLKIIDISFLPLGDGFSSSFEYEGVTYIPTADPKLKMSIKYDEAGQGRAKITGSTYTIGEINGVFRIISAKPKK